MKAKDIVKSVAKKTDLTAAKTGSDPRDGWSSSGAGGGIAIPENVTSRRADILSKYYKSKGWNVNYISKNKKVAQSKKGDFEKWKRDHGIYEDEVNEDLTTKYNGPHTGAPETRSEISKSPTLKRKRQLDQAAAHYAVKPPAGTMKHTMAKEENLDEVSLGDYKEKAKAQVKELKPHTKGEYGDIVKRAVKRREKGLAMAAKREEVELDEATKIITDGGVMNVHHNGHHIGNIMKSPSDKKTPYKAYSKHWDMKKLSKSKKDATDWLVQTHNTAMKEEVEVNEVSSELLGRYKEKAKQSADTLTAAGKHRQAADRHMNVMKATGKQMAHTISNLKKSLKQEDNFGDPKAASEAPFDMGNTPNQVAPKKMSKAASMVKEIYAKHKLKEDMYDWEKDQKDAKPMGKKPSMQKVDGSNELGDKKPKARMVLKGGTTLTGEKRDTVEIDPMLKNRTAMPDYKDMDKKNQKPQEQ